MVLERWLPDRHLTQPLPLHVHNSQSHLFLLWMPGIPSKHINNLLKKQTWGKKGGCPLWIDRHTLAVSRNLLMLGFGVPWQIVSSASHAVYASFSSRHFSRSCLGLIRSGTGTRLSSLYHAERRAFNKWYTWFNVLGIPFFKHVEQIYWMFGIGTG